MVIVDFPYVSLAEGDGSGPLVVVFFFRSVSFCYFLVVTSLIDKDNLVVLESGINNRICVCIYIIYIYIHTDICGYVVGICN